MSIQRLNMPFLCFQVRSEMYVESMIGKKVTKDINENRQKTWYRERDKMFWYTEVMERQPY